MKNFAKLSVLGIFALFSFVWFVNGLASGPGSRARAQAQPTPPANTAVNAAPVNANSSNTAAAPVSNTNSSNTAVVPANTATPAPAGGASIPANFTLAKDSQHAVYREVAFNHENHAFKPYSADGKSVVGCVVCHHTDQPPSALKPPLKTSERNVVLTMESWRAVTQKVSTCRSCHFQKDDIPDGKEMPVIGETEYNNEETYHANCNTCHDEAYKLRESELKGKPGFARGQDCLVCHKKGN